MSEVPNLPDDPAAGELGAEWETWARHIPNLSPPPGSATVARQRGWGGLAQYVTERRHLEQEQVAAGFADLRQVLEQMPYCLQEHPLRLGLDPPATIVPPCPISLRPSARTRWPPVMA